MVGLIRLAWWREALERLDHSPPPPEPRLQAVAHELLSRGIAGSRLAEIEDGWVTLLDEQPDRARVRRRGAVVFSVGAQILGVRGQDDLLAKAGATWALADVRRRGLSSADEAGTEPTPARFARAARPLSALAALAWRDGASGARDLEQEGTPARALALLKHRFTGRIG